MYFFFKWNTLYSGDMYFMHHLTNSFNFFSLCGANIFTSKWCVVQNNLDWQNAFGIYVADACLSYVGCRMIKGSGSLESGLCKRNWEQNILWKKYSLVTNSTNYQLHTLLWLYVWLLALRTQCCHCSPHRSTLLCSQHT